MTAEQIYLEQIAKNTAASTSGTSSVDVTANTAGLATGADIATVVTALSDTNVILTDLQNDIVNQNGLYKKQLIEKMSFCVLRKVENSPLLGDTTYYKGYSNNDYLANGQPILAGGTFTIERIIEDSNGNITKSWANANRYVYTLVFDDTSQNYLTYTYN